MRDSRPVVILSRWAPEPIYHLWGPLLSESRPSAPDDEFYGPDVIRRTSTNETLCGRKWARREWSVREPGGLLPGSYTSNERGVMMRRDHAEKIGRICVRCKCRTPDKASR